MEWRIGPLGPEVRSVGGPRGHRHVPRSSATPGQTRSGCPESPCRDDQREPSAAELASNMASHLLTRRPSRPQASPPSTEDAAADTFPLGGRAGPGAPRFRDSTSRSGGKVEPTVGGSGPGSGPNRIQAVQPTITTVTNPRKNRHPVDPRGYGCSARHIAARFEIHAPSGEDGVGDVHQTGGIDRDEPTAARPMRHAVIGAGLSASR